MQILQIEQNSKSFSDTESLKMIFLTFCKTQVDLCFRKKYNMDNAFFVQKKY